MLQNFYYTMIKDSINIFNSKNLSQLKILIVMQVL